MFWKDCQSWPPFKNCRGSHKNLDFWLLQKKSEGLVTLGPHFYNQALGFPVCQLSFPPVWPTWFSRHLSFVTFYTDSIVHCLPHEVSGPQVGNKRLSLYLDLKAVWKPLRSKDLSHGSKTYSTKQEITTDFHLELFSDVSGLWFSKWVSCAHKYFQILISSSKKELHISHIAQEMLAWNVSFYAVCVINFIQTWLSAKRFRAYFSNSCPPPKKKFLEGNMAV